MVGLKCHKATTTFKVAASEMKASEYANAICQSLIDGGWGELEGLKDMANSDAIELAHIAEFFPVGTILEKRGRKFQTRQ